MVGFVGVQQLRLKYIDQYKINCHYVNKIIHSMNFFYMRYKKYLAKHYTTLKHLYYPNYICQSKFRNPDSFFLNHVRDLRVRIGGQLAVPVLSNAIIAYCNTSFSKQSLLTCMSKALAQSIQRSNINNVVKAQ